MGKIFKREVEEMNKAYKDMYAVLRKHGKNMKVCKLYMGKMDLYMIENLDDNKNLKDIKMDEIDNYYAALIELRNLDEMKPEFENAKFAASYKKMCECLEYMINTVKDIKKKQMEEFEDEKFKPQEGETEEPEINPWKEKPQKEASQEGETEEPEINHWKEETQEKESHEEESQEEESQEEEPQKEEIKSQKEESQEGETKEPEISVKKSSTADNSSEPSMRTFYNEFVDLRKKQKWNSAAYNDLVFSIGVYVKERGKHKGDQEWKINIIKKINKRLDAYMDMVKKRDSTASNSMERSEKYKCCVRFKEYFEKTFPNALARITASQKAYDDNKKEMHTEMEKKYGNLFIGTGF